MASSVALGTAYERTVQALLTSFGARLSAVGGAFDQGTDLTGTWALPWPARAAAPGDRITLQCVVHAPRIVPVVVQCRATAMPFGVGAMREFQHACGSRFGGALAVVACTSGFAIESLAKEREWARARTLLLTVSPRGELLAAHSLVRAGAVERVEDAIAFVISRVERERME